LLCKTIKCVQEFPLHLSSALPRSVWRGELLNTFNSLIGDTSLALAAVTGRIHVVRELIKAGSDVNSSNLSGHTPLIMASAKGEVEVARDLITAGADLDREDVDGLTALNSAMAASTCCHQEVGEGAAMALLKRQNCTRIAQILRAAGANEDVPEDEDDLKCLCRQFIRDCLKKNNPKKSNLFFTVPALPLPRLLKEFLLFGEGEFKMRRGGKGTWLRGVVSWTAPSGQVLITRKHL